VFLESVLSEGLAFVTARTFGASTFSPFLASFFSSFLSVVAAGAGTATGAERVFFASAALLFVSSSAVTSLSA